MLFGGERAPASGPLGGSVIIGSPTVPYTPAPIIAAREADAGMWVWQPQRVAPKTMPFERLLSGVAAARSLRPRPLILFSYAPGISSSERDELRARIARTAGCSSSDPCVDGTPEQLP
jgi:hypothetical protein